MKRGTVLRILRTSLGLSQDYVAVQLGTSQKQISRYELGQAFPRINLLEDWCKLLGISVLKLEKMCHKGKGGFRF